MPQSRQLAAIMFTDIVGYTAMMEEDEMAAMNCRQKLKTKTGRSSSRASGNDH